MTTKICTKCCKEKNINQFFKNKARKDGYEYECKPCNVARTKAYCERTDYHTKWYRGNKEKRKDINAKIRANDPIGHLLRGAKSRCKKDGIPFNITVDDIEKPTYCPVFGIKLNYLGMTGICGGRQPSNTATLDRVIPSKGYVKGNVIVVSWRANELKSDATLEEMKALVAFYENTRPAIGVPYIVKVPVDTGNLMSKNIERYVINSSIN